MTSSKLALYRYLLLTFFFLHDIQYQTFLTMCRYIMAIHFAVSQKLTNFAINI